MDLGESWTGDVRGGAKGGCSRENRARRTENSPEKGCCIWTLPECGLGFPAAEKATQMASLPASLGSARRGRPTPWSSCGQGVTCGVRPPQPGAPEGPQLPRNPPHCLLPTGSRGQRRREMTSGQRGKGSLRGIFGKAQGDRDRNGHCFQKCRGPGATASRSCSSGMKGWESRGKDSSSEGGRGVAGHLEGGRGPGWGVPLLWGE